MLTSSDYFLRYLFLSSLDIVIYSGLSLATSGHLLMQSGKQGTKILKKKKKHNSDGWGYRLNIKLIIHIDETKDTHSNIASCLRELPKGRWL